MKRLFHLTDGLRHRARLKRCDAAQAWGRRGEDLAHRYLEQQGLRVVARNFELPSIKGELDLVARDGDTFVFVEVKTRASTDFGQPEDAVDQDKRSHLIRVARAYLRGAGATWQQSRFDIISVTSGDSPSIHHIRDAFRGAGPI